MHRNSCKWACRTDIRYQPPLPRQNAELHKWMFKKYIAVIGKQQPLTPSPLPWPWPCSPPAIETPPRPVHAGTLNSWPKGASCSRIPPRASRASLPLRRWAMTCCRLSLRPITVPLSCSLQPLLKLSLFSLGLSQLQFVSTACHRDSVWHSLRPCTAPPSCSLQPLLKL